MRKPVEIARPPPRFRVGVRELVDHGAGVYTLRTDPMPFPFTPGDCVAIFSRDGTVSRPYSLASAPGEHAAAFLFRHIPQGRVSSELASLRRGDEIDVSPPFGWFRPMEPTDVPRVWFATGTGIAPFRAALRAGCPPPVQLWWGVRDIRAAIEAEQLPQVRLCVSPRRITHVLNEIAIGVDAHYYLCGLDAMIDEVGEHLRRRGVEEGRIHREVFFTRGWAPGL